MSREDKNSEPVEFTRYYVLAVRERSVLVKPDGEDNSKGIWLPTSQVEVTRGDLEKGQTVDFEIPEWLATDRGMT